LRDSPRSETALRPPPRAPAAWLVVWPSPVEVWSSSAAAMAANTTQTLVVILTIHRRFIIILPPNGIPKVWSLAAECEFSPSPTRIAIICSRPCPALDAPDREDYSRPNTHPRRSPFWSWKSPRGSAGSGRRFLANQ
jgi:hypothetical protein